MSFLSALKKPFVFIGHAFLTVDEWVPKILGIAAFSEKDAKVLVPAFTAVFKDVENIASTVASDAKPVWNALKTLAQSIEGLAGTGSLNPAEYVKVISAVSTFVTDMHGLDYAEVFSAVEKLVSDYDALGADVKDAITQFEAIAKQ